MVDHGLLFGNLWWRLVSASSGGSINLCLDISTMAALCYGTNKSGVFFDGSRSRPASNTGRNKNAATQPSLMISVIQAHFIPT